jgi:DNA helicase II / ATP-dependent DNA helicase PcrA
VGGDLPRHRRAHAAPRRGRLGWTPSFLIYDADDAERLVKRIIRDELELDPKRWSPRAVLGAISAAKNELMGPETYAEQALDFFEKTVAQVYEHLPARAARPPTPSTSTTCW